MSKQLDRKLEDISFNEEWIGDSLQADLLGNYPEVIDAIKQAFIDAGWKDPMYLPSDTSLGRVGEMTGQEWYDKFEKELYVPEPQVSPFNIHSKGSEGHDRFYRAGGLNFMYKAAIDAAKKASGIE